MRILVTGMSGLVGGVVGRRLSLQHQVSALNRTAVADVPTHCADVTDAGALGAGG